jgi:hypothetical protein
MIFTIFLSIGSGRSVPSNGREGHSIFAGETSASAEGTRRFRNLNADFMEFVLETLEDRPSLPKMVHDLPF